MRALLQRLGIAVLLVVVCTLTVWFGRDGYADEVLETPDLLAAFYYATVTVTTTGYGDITPVSSGARLATALIITPLRVVFLILLVGTTFEVLTDRWRRAWTEERWSRTVRDHHIICGYGGLGRSAVETLRNSGVGEDEIVVIETNHQRGEEAASDGYVVVNGEPSRTSVLNKAGIASAKSVIVATDRDDANVLATLTAHELNPEVCIVAAVHDAENRHLLLESGAQTVITAAQAAGRLLGLATSNPRTVGVLQDLMSVGEGLELVTHRVSEEEAGSSVRQMPGQLSLAIMRDEEIFRATDTRATRLEPGDQIFGLRSVDGDPDVDNGQDDERSS
jgi:voltage-gated potassium channel